MLAFIGLLGVAAFLFAIWRVRLSTSPDAANRWLAIAAVGAVAALLAGAGLGRRG